MESDSESPDLLSATFWRMRVPNWNVHAITLTDALNIQIPSGVVSLFVVRAGIAQVEVTENSKLIELRPGNHVVLSGGQSHRLCSRLDNPIIPLERSGKSDSDLGADVCDLFLATFPLASAGTDPVATALPEILHLTETNRISGEIEPILDLILHESSLPQPGSSTILSHLIHIVFLSTLRASVTGDTSNRADSSASWLRAALDPKLGPVITMMHTQPEKYWTVESIARQANMSRTRFSEAFRVLTGQPPLQYLTECRMQRACELLRETNFGIKRIAAMVGYKSPTSFSIAFKRFTGQTPLEYRQSSGSR